MKKKLVSLILVAAMLGTLIAVDLSLQGMDRPARRARRKARQLHREKPPSRLKHLKTRTSGR
ncbi:MAG: hypothetical protein ACLVAW_11580 [Eisenbergiella massiliensis]